MSEHRSTADESGYPFPPKPAGAPTAHFDYFDHPAPPPAFEADPAPAPEGPAKHARTGFAPGLAAGRYQRGRVALATAVAAVAAVLGGVIGGTVVEGGHTAASTSASAPTVVSPVSDQSGTANVAAISSAVSPSVVQITVQTSGGSDIGTGIILTAGGQILTNYHVISSAVSDGGSITVTFNNGAKTTGTVTGTDKSSDLAVITAGGASGLKPATLGSSGALQVGDQVVAIGNPDGLTGTVTSGIISAKDRPVTVQVDETTTRGNGGFGFPFLPGYNSRPSNSGSTATYSALQTDAALNPGNSGGPLINAAGQVIGVNSAMYSGSGNSGSGSGQGGSVGLGFAIPIDTVKQVLPKMQAGQNL
ncbi:S1C family serine protease [Kitasatospora humi]|uniref:S1C family serine protease n=1 Tax=Kitasatospora humi TaxID=2893891 RepID=UPI0024C0B436|nr:trypsin-like peptidase domain-containing protein [Kitasatospora humi]